MGVNCGRFPPIFKTETTMQNTSLKQLMSLLDDCRLTNENYITAILSTKTKRNSKIEKTALNQLVQETFKNKELKAEYKKFIQ